MTPAAERDRAIAAAHWRTAATAHASLAVLVGSAAEPLLPELGDAVERAITSDLAWLGQPTVPVNLRLYFVGARQEMVPFVGAPMNGAAATDAGMAFMVANDTVRPALHHELMHVLSFELWGPPTSVWMDEGVATVALGRCRGYPIDDLVAAVDRAGRLPAFDDLRFHFVERGEQEAIDYFTAASIIAYINRVYGRERVRALWRETNPGTEVEAFAPAWRAEITRHQTPASWNTIFPGIRAHGCE